MVDFRAELAALVAAYDNHRKWTINAVFDGLRQAVEHARAVLAQPEPAPAADGEVAKLVAALRIIAVEADRACQLSDADVITCAANLLERQALRPIPVSERLPGPDDCAGAGDCWWYSSFMDDSAWITGDVEYGKRHRFRYWLPAHALPLPEFDHE